MDREQAIKVLIETGEAYLLINGDDGVLEPEEKSRIEQALNTMKTGGQ